MEYRDFAIELQTNPGGKGYRARVLESPYHRPEHRVALRWSPEEVEELLTALDSDLCHFIRSRGKPEKRKPVLRSLKESYETLGQDLYRKLFVGEIGRIFRESRAFTQGAEARLRLRLVFDPRHQELCHLAALPWELLEKSAESLVVRCPDVPRPIRPLPVKGCVRVLVLVAKPGNLPGFDCEAEVQAIRRVAEEERIEVTVYEQPSYRGLQRRLRDEDFHVLHFIGHAFFDNDTGEGKVALVAPELEPGDEPAGRLQPGTCQGVPGEKLADLVRGLPKLRLVVLNSCQTGALQRRRGQDPFASVAPALVLADVPAVVAMQFRISHQAAIHFSRKLYSDLARREPVDVAVSNARHEISADTPTAAEWVTPTLFLRPRDGQLFAPPSPENQAAEPPPSLTDGRNWHRLGIRSFAKGFGEGMEEHSDSFLDLCHCFENNRYILDPALWQHEIFPELRRFLNDAARSRRPIRLDLAAHSSIAFAAGYCLEAKSGLDIEIYQRRYGGGGSWWSQDRMWPEGRLWLDEPPPTLRQRLRQRLDRLRRTPCRDVALAISATHVVLPDVDTYRRQSGLDVHRILPATVHPEPGQASIQGGAHAMRLAQQLATKIHARTAAERNGVLHVFAAAPNALVFFLGQLSRSFGRIQLYEHAFGSAHPADYRPSIVLPNPRDAF